MSENGLWKHLHPGVERLSGRKQILVMCCLASAAFPGSSFAQQPSLVNPLDLPLTWRRLIQWLFGLCGTKKISNNIFQTK
jgi:hypothetical protein